MPTRARRLGTERSKKAKERFPRKLTPARVHPQVERGQQAVPAKTPTVSSLRRARRTVAAAVVDHIRPHRGDQALFWMLTTGSRCASDATTSRLREANDQARSQASRSKSQRASSTEGRVATAHLVPDPPPHLGMYGVQYWNEHAPKLIEAQILTPLHLESFVLLCEQYHRYRRLSSWLDEDPGREVFVTENGYQQETPQVRMRDKSLGGTVRIVAQVWNELPLHWPRCESTAEWRPGSYRRSSSSHNGSTPIKRMTKGRHA